MHVETVKFGTIVFAMYPFCPCVLQCRLYIL